MHYLDIDLLNVLRSNVNIPIESQYMAFYLMVTLISALSVSVYEIFNQHLHDLDLDL